MQPPCTPWTTSVRHVCTCKGSTQVDMAAILLGSLTDLHTHQAALACLRAVHAALIPGGLFVIELDPPGDIFDGSFQLVSPNSGSPCLTGSRA